jgi:hypothetical protein
VRAECARQCDCTEADQRVQRLDQPVQIPDEQVEVRHAKDQHDDGLDDPDHAPEAQSGGGECDDAHHQKSQGDQQAEEHMNVSKINVCNPGDQAKHQGAQPGKTNDDLEKTCSHDDYIPPFHWGRARSIASVVSRLTAMSAETICMTIIVQKMCWFMPVAGSHRPARSRRGFRNETSRATPATMQ